MKTKIECKIIAATVIATIFVVLSASVSTARPDSNQRTTFINVEQGDSVLVRDGNGFNVLIDGGKPGAGPVILEYLRQQGVTQIDVMVATHADYDHIGGLINVLQAVDIQVKKVIYNGYPGTTATWVSFESAVTADGLSLIPAQFPQEFDWGAIHVHVLNPASGLVSPEQNNASIVALLEYGNVNYLFTGDIDSTVEATVVARGTPVAAEILKVAHHGSKYSSSDAFLSAVLADDAVISVGPNSYGHPAEETITRLQNAGAMVWRTDVSGNIEVISDGITYSVNRPLDIRIFMPIVIRN